MRKRERYNYEDPRFSPLRDPMRRVMTAFLNAERFFASIKEVVWGRFGLKYTSDAIHSLEHIQPEMIDRFGAALHEMGLELEYPATPELDEPLGDLDEVFRVCVDLIDETEGALSEFIRTAERQGFYSMALKTEALQEENGAERTKLLEAWSMWDNNPSKSSFDRWVKSLFDLDDDGEVDD